MPELNETLTREFEGRPVDAAELKCRGWYDQERTDGHYGYARRKGLWIKPLEPVFRCEHHPVRLYLLLTVTDGRVASIQTAVHQPYADGSFDDLGADLFPPDVENARLELAEVVGTAPESVVSAGRARSPRPPGSRRRLPTKGRPGRKGSRG